MNKSSGDKHTSTEMLAEEEDLRWDFHPLDLFSNDRKATTTDRCEEDDDCLCVSCVEVPTNYSMLLTDCSHVQRKVVFRAIGLAPAHWLLGRHCG
jgi:hypothetical protein